MKRREWLGYVSTPGHDCVMKSAIPFLRATIVTGYMSNGCGPWAEGSEKSRLNDLIRHVWAHIGCRVGVTMGRLDSDVDEVPAVEEAKKVGKYVSLTQKPYTDSETRLAV